MVATNKTAEDNNILNQRKGRAKQVLREIIRQAGGEFAGRLALFKAFYLAHLLYAEKGLGGYLTEWPIVRMPHGPGIHSADTLLSELVEEGALVVTSKRGLTELSPPETYKLMGEQPEDAPLSDVARAAIGDAVKFVKGKSAIELSEWTHERSRAWNQAKDGDELNIYIDLIPEEEYIELNKRMEDVWQAIQWQERPPSDESGSQ